jgi:hypothetical protein
VDPGVVYMKLKAFYGMDWWDEAEKALNRARVPVELTTRYLAKDKQHPHISTPENDPLWFISFESLLKIIFDARLWKLFEVYFTTKKLLRVRFEEILPIRNRVAHCRNVHAYDVSRLEQLTRDLDQGFWHFCKSDNSRYCFAGELSKNKVYDHFKSARTENLGVYYSVRPFAAARKPRPQLDRDFIST